jgi:putative heme-binding domain-containing protein
MFLSRVSLPVLAVFKATITLGVAASPEVPVKIAKGEKVALVGGAFGDVLGQEGTLEALWHLRMPQGEVVVRNFCRPADAVDVRQRPGNYTAIDDPFAVFGANTVICFYGFNESFAGADGLAKFKSDYAKTLDGYTKGKAQRLVLVSPAAFEGANDGRLPDGKKENANLALYAKATEELAKERGLVFVDLFEATNRLFSKDAGLQFTSDGARLSPAGAREVAALVDRALFGNAPAAKPGVVFEKLRVACADKAWVHAQDYRMLNGWYVYGGRRTHDKETFPKEYVKIRNMVSVRDRFVWDIAQGKAVGAKPDDSKTGELFEPKTMFGTQPKKEPKELKYPTPEESIATMKVPEGMEVQLIASEREVPGLANVNQLNIDNKGRVWVSCMSTYPQWKPGAAKPSCKLIILDQLDAKTGRAGKSTVFTDKLICPTGFEFWNGGVIVVDEPRLIWLKDTNGDDKADLEVVLSDGWATDDTHHTIGAFEWSPGGLLHMLEGVSMSTAVETPWGPVRKSGKPGCYIFDPLTRKIRHFVTPGYGNPWCYVFDEWGQGIVGDGTTPQQHWDTPLSGAAYAGRKGLNTVLGNADGMRPNVGNEWIRSRHFPDDWQGAFIFACVINMNGLTTFTVGDDGAGFKGSRRKGGDLLFAQDNMTFRPTDPQIGADGALYFGDWSAALIGHMQYSQRDPNRDQSHGRVFRLVNKNKPLLPPATQFGKTVPQLLAQLSEYEPRTRYRARRELRDRPTTEVIAAIKALKPTDDRLALECLWVQQGHHAVDVALLKQVLRAKTPQARAAATRVLSDEWERIPGALDLMKAQVADDFARTRVEAIRALSFVPTKESVEAVLLAADKPRDYWIDYTLNATLGALEPVWKPLHKDNKLTANPAGLALLTELDHAGKPGGSAVAALKKFLAKPDMPEAERKKISAEIAKAGGVADNGKAVFRRICIACHKWGGEGIEYGPSIDGLAKRMKREDIVESILEPNAIVATQFVTTTVETKSGGNFVGFIASETAEKLTLKIAGGATQEIAIADIKKRESQKVSSMPEGLANAMSPEEFLDLIEFLSPGGKQQKR